MKTDAECNDLTDLEYPCGIIPQILDRLLRKAGFIGQFLDRHFLLLHQVHGHLVEIHEEHPGFGSLLLNLLPECEPFRCQRAFPIPADVFDVLPAPADAFSKHAVDDAGKGIVIFIPENQAARGHIFPGTAFEMRYAEPVRKNIFRVVQAVMALRVHIQPAVDHRPELLVPQVFANAFFLTDRVGLIILQVG